MKKIAVVAFGGNALLRGNEIGTIAQQEKNTYDTCLNLIPLLEQDYNIVITHGNGPQVGNIVLRNEAGYNQFKIPKMPLDICVADSQGGIGYMIEKVLRNILNERKIRKNIVTVVTQVLVDINDPAFKEPSKPVGAFYLKEEADLLARSNNWIFKEDPRKRGWRRVVASPQPVDVLNKKVVKDLAKKNIVIAVGGGGIPVVKDKKKHLTGVEAVIDKDLASSLLATEIGADTFIVLTDVPYVYLNFHKPGQQELHEIDYETAKAYLEQGEFAQGSMGPKVKAALNFIAGGGKEAVITEASMLSMGGTGTKIKAKIYNQTENIYGS
jgi:carbamate kinase